MLHDYVAHLRLAFASAPWLNHLTLPHNITRRPVLQKVRDHAITVLLLRSALSACKHTVSGSLSLPSRGSFHLSLTVLYSIGHLVVFSLMRWSSYLHAEFHVFHTTLDTAMLKNSFTYETITLCCPPFQVCSVRIFKCNVAVRTPLILLLMVWALTRSLATT